MKKIYYFLLISIFFILNFNNVNAQCANQANIYSFSFNGKNYEIIKELKNWTSASACAVERGGHLVHIESSDENSAMMQAVSAAGISSTYTTVWDGGGIAYLWIGATDKTLEGTWIWDGDNNNTGLNFWIGQGTAGSGGGSAVGNAYNNWGTSSWGSEPDDFENNQDGAGIALGSWPYGSPGQWNDIDLANQIYYIVEYEPTGMVDTPDECKIFPNPANQLISLLLTNPGPGNLKISLYSPDGKLLQSTQSPPMNKIYLDVSDLINGLYLLSIEKNNQCIKRKIVVIRP